MSPSRVVLAGRHPSLFVLSSDVLDPTLVGSGWTPSAEVAEQIGNKPGGLPRSEDGVAHPLHDRLHVVRHAQLEAVPPPRRRHGDTGGNGGPHPRSDVATW